MDLVSVIIPTFNRGYCIKSSIESVLRQIYSEVECIVVDDGSTDDTKRVIDSIPDNRVRYIYLSDNRGSSYARNVGIESAKGNYIAFNDSDDIWYASKLEEQMYKFRGTENFGLVYCDYLYKGDGKETIMPSDSYDLSELEGEIFQSLLNDNKIGTPTIVIKRECIKEIGGFKEDLRSLEDWEFVLRVAEKYSIGYVHKTLMQARYSTSGVNSDIEAQLKTIIYILKKYKDKGFSLKSLKKILFNKISFIENMQYLKEIKQESVPAIISGDEEFDCIMEFALEIRKLKKVSQILADFSKVSSFDRFVDQNLNKDTDVIAIYGAGVVGFSTAYNLLKRGIRIICLIDKKKKNDMEFEIVRPENLDRSVSVIISTILSENIEALQALWERNIKIINIFDVLKY